jgi:hypothetical protein
MGKYKMPIENEYDWDFSDDNSEIIVTRFGKVIMHIGVAEVIDCSKPEYIMNHIYNVILPCKWRVGKWREYFDEKLLDKLAR